MCGNVSDGVKGNTRERAQFFALFRRVMNGNGLLGLMTEWVPLLPPVLKRLCDRNEEVRMLTQKVVGQQKDSARGVAKLAGKERPREFIWAQNPTRRVNLLPHRQQPTDGVAISVS